MKCKHKKKWDKFVKLFYSDLVDLQSIWMSAKLKDKEYTINAPIFFIALQKKKKMDAPNL